MYTIKYVSFIFMIILMLSSCVQHVKSKSMRTITLNGDQIKENTPGEFISWYCRDYSRGGKTLLEVGLTSAVFKSVSGYVLYDGTNEGEIAFYQRKGLNHRWNWGPKLSSYAFIIKPDGTGVYYDFSNADDGESVKANEIYKCTKH